MSGVWVKVKKAATFPEVKRVYKRAGEGQGASLTGQAGPGSAPNSNSSLLMSAPQGFLQTVRRLVQGSNPNAADGGAPLPAWIRKPPGGVGGAVLNFSWQDYQVDVTQIPGVRPLRSDGKFNQGLGGTTGYQP